MPNRFTLQSPRNYLGLLACLIGAAFLVYNQAYRLPVGPGQRIPGPLDPNVPRQQPYFHYNDFKHIWLGAALLRQGGNPYDGEQLHQFSSQTIRQRLNPYVYPAFNGLVLGLLTPLKISKHPQRDFAVAANRWTLLQYFFLLTSLALIVIAVPFARPYEALAPLLLLLAFSFPLTRTLTAGQLNLALLLIYALAALLAARGGWKQFAFWTAFGAWFKLAPGILFFYLLAVKRFKAALACAGFAAAIFLLLLLWAGWSVNLAFLPVALQMGYGRSTWTEYGMTFHVDPHNQSINAFLLHVLSANGVTRPWLEFSGGAALANGLSYLIALALLFGVGRATWRHAQRQDAAMIAAGNNSAFQKREGEAPAEPRRENKNFGEPQPLQHGKISEGGADAVNAVHRLDELLCLSLWIFLGQLLPSLNWDHYAVILILPQAILLAAILRRPRPAPQFYLALALWLLCGLLLDCPFPFGAEQYHSGWRVLILSHKLLATLMLFTLNWIYFAAAQQSSRGQQASA